MFSHGKIDYSKVLHLLLLFIFVVLITRYAWICDDAFITFRTVYNFVNGFGLTWNPPERVQVYTHPLWMFLMSLFYFFTREIYFTNIFISIFLSFLALYIYDFKLLGCTWSAIFGIVVFISSKAFVTYSTSGLENPLTHFLLVLFFLVYFKWKVDFRNFLLLSLIGSIGVLNRMDTFLIFLPPLVYAFSRLRQPKKGSVALLVGFIPFIFWEFFSLFYYGFLFPNTAYAKLNTGIAWGDLAMQGVIFLMHSLIADPVTLPIIVIGIIVSFRAKKKHDLPVALGIILYVLYIVKIGGDYVTGRYLTAPFLCAVILISRILFQSGRKILIFSILVILLGFGTSYIGIPQNRNVGVRGIPLKHNVGDDMQFLNIVSINFYLNDVLKGRVSIPEVQSQQGITNSFFMEKAIGCKGYFSGPYVYILDLYALADPFLSRLQVKDKENFWIGHFERPVPTGYRETLMTGHNLIKNKKLSIFYDKLSIITKGKIFDRRRIVEIFKMNTGVYDNLIEDFYIPPMLHVE